MEDHVLLRGSKIPRARRRQARAQSGTRIDQGTRRRSRRGVSRRFPENGCRARVALVRDAAHVPEGRLPNRRSSRDERRADAENDLPTTGEETLIAGLEYSASRAGRSAGRSLSWHGRGRGFKSHPVHSRSSRGSFEPPFPSGSSSRVDSKCCVLRRAVKHGNG